MDLTDIRTEVRARIQELTADFYTDTEVDNAINEAQRRFCNEEKWPFLLTEFSSTLSVGSDELDLPNNVSLNRIFNISISGDVLPYGRMLERVDPQEGFRLRQMYNITSPIRGIPRWYYITRSNQDADGAPPIIYTAKFVPLADNDYTVDGQYMMVPLDLTGGADEPTVPIEYQEAIVAWATGKLFLKEFSISQKASEQFSIYAKVLEQARQDLKTFDLDEVVALGRRNPLRGAWDATNDVRYRTPPTLG